MSKKPFVIYVFLMITLRLHAQYADNFNPVWTAVSYLSISDDVRGRGMGDVGVALSHDVFSVYYNPSKYAYAEKDISVGISYSPWMKRIAQDVSFSNIAACMKLSERQAIALSMRYFNMGDINIIDVSGNSLGFYRAYDMAFDFTYARMLTDNLSMAVTPRFIFSKLSGGNTSQQMDLRSGTSVAADVSLYQQFVLDIWDKNCFLSWGLNISNIGSKITYMQDKSNKRFLPTTLRLGPALGISIDKSNRVNIGVDFTKFLVPSLHSKAFAHQLPDDVSVVTGIVKSFSDAPGGFKEELKEIAIGVGLEYVCQDMFALRTGVFYEDKTKGIRRYASFGASLLYKDLTFDFSYIAPFENSNMLGNTISFGLQINFGRKGKILSNKN